MQLFLLLSCLLSVQIVARPRKKEPKKLSKAEVVMSKKHIAFLKHIQQQIEQDEDPIQLDTYYKILDYSNHEALIASIEDDKNCVGFYVQKTSGTSILNMLDPVTNKNARQLAEAYDNKVALNAIYKHFRYARINSSNDTW